MKIEMLWNLDDVRSMCIRYDYSSGMDNDEYERLLHYIRDHECNANEIE